MKKLKVLFPLFLIALSVGFMSCSDDDEDDEQGSQNLVGTWLCSYFYESEITYENGKEVDRYVEDLSYPEDSGSEGIGGKIRLDADGKIYEQDYNQSQFNFAGTWSYKGGNFTTVYIEEDEDEEYEDKITMPVTKLTDTEFICEKTEKYRDNKNSGYDHYSKIIFQKVK